MKALGGDKREGVGKRGGGGVGESYMYEHQGRLSCC